MSREATLLSRLRALLSKELIQNHSQLDAVKLVTRRDMPYILGCYRSLAFGILVSRRCLVTANFGQAPSPARHRALREPSELRLSNYLPFRTCPRISPPDGPRCGR